MSDKRFHVDIPNRNGIVSDDTSWENIRIFETREDAIEFARKCWGADESGNVCLVLES